MRKTSQRLPRGFRKANFDALLAAAQQQHRGGGGLLGNLLFGQKGFMGMFPQLVQENGLVGSLVNRLTAPSTGQGMPIASSSRAASRKGRAATRPAGGFHFPTHAPFTILAV